MKKIPTFLIVGAAKAGTTSLFHYLNQHPDIYIPSRKECKFFSGMPGNFHGPGADRYQNDIIKTVEEYRHLFDTAGNAHARGDVSNDYLFYFEKTIRNIKKYLGDEVRIITVLRNPVERAYSNYLHHVEEGWEVLTFEQALKACEERIEDDWPWTWRYKRVGLYFEQVNAYIANFSNVKIMLYEDLLNTEAAVRDIYSFVGVDPDFKPDLSTRYNVTGVPKSKWLHKFLRHDNLAKKVLRPFMDCLLSRDRQIKGWTMLNNMNLRKPPIRDATMRYLKAYFRDNVLKLQGLIGRDLSHWIA